MVLVYFLLRNYLFTVPIPLKFGVLGNLSYFELPKEIGSGIYALLIRLVGKGAIEEAFEALSASQKIPHVLGENKGGRFNLWDWHWYS